MRLDQANGSVQNRTEIPYPLRSLSASYISDSYVSPFTQLPSSPAHLRWLSGFGNDELDLQLILICMEVIADGFLYRPAVPDDGRSGAGDVIN